jgi:hypothetical protein
MTSQPVKSNGAILSQTHKAIAPIVIKHSQVELMQAPVLLTQTQISIVISVTQLKNACHPFAL